MKRTTLLIGLGFSALLLHTNLVFAQSEKGGGSITINALEGDVSFPHGRHQAIFVDCRPCHDLFPKMPRAIRRVVGEGKVKKQEVMEMCKNCHELRAAKGEKAGPTACKGCHGK